jgi:hypothetical protein
MRLDWVRVPFRGNTLGLFFDRTPGRDVCLEISSEKFSAVGRLAVVVVIEHLITTAHPI